MPNYRVYRLDNAGHIVSADFIVAKDDQKALELVRQDGHKRDSEVWRGTECIGSVIRS